MAHFDRGVYEPSDEVRVFDGSEDDEDVEGSRLPLLIVLALLVLAMFGGVVWLAYTQGVARGRTETPVLTAQNGPARVAPQNPGGVEEAYKGFKVYQQPAPADEAPAAPAATAPAAPSQMAVAEPAPVKPAPVAVTPAPVAKPEPVKAAPKPEPVKAEPVKAVPAPKPAPVVVAKPVIAKPAAPATIPATANAAPRSLTAPTAAPPKPVAAAAPAASGNYVLQIGAYKSQADADAAWKTYKGRHAALLAGASYQVQQADLGEKGTWYRLRITGYPSKDVASAMCDRLKADGGACLPGK